MENTEEKTEVVEKTYSVIGIKKGGEKVEVYSGKDDKVAISKYNSLVKLHPISIFEKVQIPELQLEYPEPVKVEAPKEESTEENKN